MSPRFAVLLPLVAAIVVALAWRHVQQRAQVARGSELFHGDAALTGRIVGHAMVLPAAVSRCMNCHETRSTARSAAAVAVAAAPGSSGAAAGTYAPVLDRAQLAEARARRGGPASRYDAAALCTLLRSGVDPAQVMVPQAMPRYDLPEADCAALWAYLVSR